MDARDHLFYGFGYVAYALALADGAVQYQEHNAIHSAIEKAMKEFTYEFTLADIAFQVLEEEHFDVKTAYRIGLKNMHLGNDHLTDEYRSKFVKVLEEIAESYPPVTTDEQHLVDQFKEDIKTV